MGYIVKQQISLLTAVMGFSRMVLQSESLLLVYNVPNLLPIYVRMLLAMTV